MRFHTLAAVLIFLSVIAVSLHDYFYVSATAAAKALAVRKAFCEKRFIAESFRNTCQGKGFSSLEEWQVCCRQMFNLEYIAWCSSEEFMIDPYASDDNTLMYGKWICSQTKDGTDFDAGGEVYCRIKER